MITLSPENWSRLLEAERQLADQLLEFPKAEACGIDCQEWRRKVSEKLNQIQQLKANYSPQG